MKKKWISTLNFNVIQLQTVTYYVFHLLLLNSFYNSLEGRRPNLSYTFVYVEMNLLLHTVFDECYEVLRCLLVWTVDWAPDGFDVVGLHVFSHDVSLVEGRVIEVKSKWRRAHLLLDFLQELQELLFVDWALMSGTVEEAFLHAQSDNES